MPKTPIDYQNTVIYKIVSKNLDIKEMYIGHTTNFNKRRQHHKDRATNECEEAYNVYIYKFLR